MPTDAPVWTAIVLAGQRPGPDPLAKAFGVRWKVLIPVGGVPMGARVVATLLATPAIARIVVLAPDDVAAAMPPDPRVCTHRPEQGISASIAALAGSAAAPWPVIVATGDHPLLTPAMIDAAVTGANDADVAVAMVERRAFAARFPGNRRTWLKFRGGQYSGANLFVLRTPKARAALDLWARAEQDRKQALKLFWHFGPRLALRAVTRTIRLDDALRRAGARLGLDARLILLNDAEAAIDVDKPSDHALAESILREREGREIAG